MFTRRRVALLAVVLVAMGALVVTAIRSVPANCAYSTPIADLPDSLRVQGGFAQSFDAGDIRGLEDAATVAATTVHTDLIGTTAVAPVNVDAPDTTTPGAVVVPLQRRTSATAVPRVAGLVVFLRDCSGQLHYATIVDLTAAPRRDFPAVDKATAAAALGGDVTLVYTTDPTKPVWRAVHGGATTAGT